MSNRELLATLAPATDGNGVQIQRDRMRHACIDEPLVCFPRCPRPGAASSLLRCVSRGIEAGMHAYLGEHLAMRILHHEERASLRPEHVFLARPTVAAG